MSWLQQGLLLSSSGETWTEWTDGITVFPFRQGKISMWYAICVNTVSAKHTINCASAGGAAARAAEQPKRHHYVALAKRYDFVPLAVELNGVPRPAIGDLLLDIGR